MNKPKRMALAIFASFVFFACSKTNSSAPGSSSWSYHGLNYKGKATAYYDSIPGGGSVLESTDTAGNLISIFFNVKSSQAGVFSVSDGFGRQDTQCYIQFTDGTNTYLTDGMDGDKLTVTVSGGKATATFSNVTASAIYGATGTYKISGTLVEQ